MNLRAATVKVFSAQVLTAVISFAGIAFFAQLLPPAQLGIYFLFEAILGVLSVFADFGLRNALTKRMSEGENQGAYLISAIILMGGILILIGGVLFLATPLINAYVGANIAIVLFITLVIRNYASLLLNALRGVLRVEQTAILLFLRRATWLASGAYLLTIGYNLYAPILGLLLGNGVMLLGALIRLPISGSMPTRESALSLLRFSRYSVIGSIGGYAYNWIDVLLLGFFLGSASVSYYEAAWRVSVLVLLAPAAIRTAVFPQVSAWNAADREQAIENIMSQMITPALLFAIPALFGVLAIGDQLLLFLFGESYVVASLVLLILVAEKSQEAVYKVLGQMVEALNHPELTARAIVIAIVVNLIINVILIPRFGILGAAIGTTIASVTSTLLVLYYLTNFVTIEIDYRSLGWIVIASVVMYLVVRAVMIIYPITSIVRILLVIGFAGIVYGSVLLLSSQFRAQLRQTFSSVIT